jgi:hypothetical protein
MRKYRKIINERIRLEIVMDFLKNELLFVYDT